jgi:hypothetical protein
VATPGLYIAAPQASERDQAPALEQRVLLDVAAANMPEPEADGISISRCRELLGAQALHLSDGEVDAIRRHAQMMAQALIDVFLDAPRT